MMKTFREDCVVATIVIALSILLLIYRPSVPPGSEQNTHEIKCSRCGHEGSSMTYTTVGKPTIHLCQACVYAQAENFLQFCPIEDQDKPVGAKAAKCD